MPGTTIILDVTSMYWYGIFIAIIYKFCCSDKSAGRYLDKN